MRSRHQAGMMLLALAWFARVPQVQALEITYSGSASIATKGSCHSPYVSTVAGGFSTVRSTAGPSAVKVPASVAAQLRCTRLTKRFKKRVCGGLCAGGDTDPTACALCTSSTPCDPQVPVTEVAATDTVTLDLRYQPSLDGSHQWGCVLRLSKDGAELFKGTCATPSLLPLVVRDPERLYVMPFGVTDTSANNWATTPTSFGSFHGYLFVTQRALEAPDTATPADIVGVSGELTYMLGIAWMQDVMWHAPWQLGSLPIVGYSCIYAGHLQSGAVTPW